MKIWVISILSLFLFSCKEFTSDSFEPRILKNFKKNKVASNLPDYSYAGYEYGETSISNKNDLHSFNVLDFGATPNDSIDDTDAINKTIETAGKNHGGIVMFPRGTFLVNSLPSKTNIVRINHSNIILRGSGSENDGTIIFSGSSTNQNENDSPWLSPFVFHSGLNLHDTHSFFHVDSIPPTSSISKSVSKNETIIPVISTEKIRKGDYIMISLQNTDQKGNLIHELMQPLVFEKFQKSYVDAGKQKARSFQWLVEVDSILDSKTIKIAQPTRRKIDQKFNPIITIIPMLKNIGVEHFYFKSAWDGNYKHHGNREMDYGWGAINLHRVANGWIKDIHIDNYTQSTQLVNSKNVTIEDILITGKSGHYGPKMYHSSDNLVQDIDVKSKMTHGPSLEGCSFGNVFRNIKFKHPSTIDLHGIGNPGFCPPMYNLFENISNIEKIAGGGAPQNLPHSGEYNTFWDIEIEGWRDGEFNELFYSWIWREPKRFKNKLHIDCHKQYLRSNVVALRSKTPHKKLSIEHQFQDRNDPYIYVEGLNTTKKVVPLYSTQLSLRIYNQKH